MKYDDPELAAGTTPAFTGVEPVTFAAAVPVDDCDEPIITPPYVPTSHVHTRFEPSAPPFPLATAATTTTYTTPPPLASVNHASTPQPPPRRNNAWCLIGGSIALTVCVAVCICCVIPIIIIAVVLVHVLHSQVAQGLNNYGSGYNSNNYGGSYNNLISGVDNLWNNTRPTIAPTFYH
jgi:hypothetical protein